MRPGAAMTIGGRRPGATGIPEIPAAAAPGFSLVERKLFTGAGVTSYSFAGLFGNTDGIYMVDFRVKASAGLSLYLRPNGLTSGFFAMQNGGTAVADAFLGVQGAGANNWVFGTAIWSAVAGAAGTRRMWTSVFGWGTTNPAECRSVVGVWDDGTTEITSLNLVSSVASGILADSMVTVYKGRV